MAIEILQCYTYRLLDSSEVKLIEEASRCLAETFIGVQVGEHFIQEPMASISNLTVESFYEFVKGYIESVVEQGYCFIAQDEYTGEIVGVLASDIFNPEEELPVFEGDLEPMNHIVEFLVELDARFIQAIEQKTGQKVKKGEYIHGFMIGVKAKNDKSLVAMELVKHTLEKAKKEGYKGFFVEATNFRSQKLVKELFNFYVPNDIYGQPIATKYENDEVFRKIPKELGVECQILYKPLQENAII